MTAYVYRCAKCGSGKHLMVWAGANIHGPLGADGEIASYEYVDDWGIHEDSIQCSKHPDGVIEKSVSGQWCRWWSCPKCNGTGRTRVGESWKAPEGYSCSGGLEIPDRHGPYTIHKGWRPAEEVLALATLPSARRKARMRAIHPGLRAEC